MADLSGPVDVTGAFARGFSAIADANIARQKLALQAAQMTQNYALHSRKIDMEAQRLPLELQAKAAATSASLAHTQAVIKDSTWRNNQRTMQSNAITEIHGDIEGSGYEPGTPEFLKTVKESLMRNPDAAGTDMFKGLMQSLKEQDPQNAQTYDALASSAPGPIRNWRINKGGISMSGDLGGTSTKPMTMQQQVQARNFASSQAQALANKYLPVDTKGKVVGDPQILINNNWKSSNGIEVPQNEKDAIYNLHQYATGGRKDPPPELALDLPGQQPQSGPTDYRAMAQQALDDPEATDNEKAKARQILGL